MELTIEQKKKKYERDKEWKKNNPERVKEYNKKNYEKHKEYHHEYYLNYYPTHKERMMETQRIWRERNLIDSVYRFVNIEGKVLYWGSSARFQERISSHCTANSHLKMSAEDMVSVWKLDKIEYQDYSEYNLSRDDLYYIEKYHKNKEKEILKTAEVNYNENKLTRSKEYLQSLADSLEFVDFDKLERYLD